MSAPVKEKRRFVVHVCPVNSCRVIHVHGLDGDLELQRTPAYCYGSDAPGYPDGHPPAEFNRVEVEECVVDAF